MAVSSTATFDPQRDALIKRAGQLAGVVYGGHDPDADQVAFGAASLQAHLLSLQARGLIVRTVERYSQILTSGTASYSAPADTIEIEDHALVRDSSSIDSDVRRISVQEYMGLSLKTTTSRPTEMYVEKGTGGLTVYLYPVPDATVTTLIYLRVRKIRDTDTGTVTLDLEPKWINPVTYMVAHDFAVAANMLTRAAYLRKMYEDNAGTAMLDETGRGRIRFVAGSNR